MTCRPDAQRVFDVWQRACDCDLGADITDCPGPPTNDRIERVRAWLADQSQPIDEYPFSEPESWAGYLELHE